MPKKSKGNLIGAWAFLIGVILAVIIGLFSLDSNIALGILFVLGVIVGILNVGDEDVKTFLFAAMVLVIVSYMGAGALAIIPRLGSVLGSLLVLFVPATIIVALKAVFSIARS